jgi:hypothetical protein
MADEKKEDTRKEYRLKVGRKHFDGDTGQAVKPGDKVKLTEAQAKAFSDKFERLDAPPEEPEQPFRFPQANPGVPQDVGAKTRTSDLLDDKGEQKPAGEIDGKSASSAPKEKDPNADKAVKNSDKA